MNSSDARGDEAWRLLRELASELPETWDEDLTGCRWEVDAAVGISKEHEADCIWRRVKEFVAANRS